MYIVVLFLLILFLSLLYLIQFLVRKSREQEKDMTAVKYKIYGMIRRKALELFPVDPFDKIQDDLTWIKREIFYYGGDVIVKLYLDKTFILNSTIYESTFSILESAIDFSKIKNENNRIVIDGMQFALGKIAFLCDDKKSKEYLEFSEWVRIKIEGMQK